MALSLKHFPRSLSFFLLLGLFFSSGAQAAEEKNLKGRLGVGFTNQIATSANGTIPAVSAKYYLSRTSALSTGLGFDTQSNNSTLGMGLKYYKNVFLESNLIFYGGLGVAFVSRSGSKLQFSAFFGSEFFLSQLPSLGLSFEAGIRGDNTTGSFALRTIGDSFLSAGMHFYF